MARIAVLKSRRTPVSRDDATDGGSINAILNIDHLVDCGHEVHVFTRAEDARSHTSHHKTVSGADVWSVPFVRSSVSNVFQRDLMEGESFVRGVTSSAPFVASAFDVLHIHHWTSGVGLELHIPERVPMVFTPHLLPTEKARTLGVSCPAGVEAVQRALIARATKVIALSGSEADAVRSSVDIEPDLVPNGVGEEFLCEPIALRRSGRIRVGCVGRLAAQKGQDLLFAALQKLGVPCDIELVGHSYDEFPFEQQIRRLAAEFDGNVTIHDQVSHGEIAELMRSWDLYVQPSRYESQGIALLEAMGVGLAVVSTPSDAVSEYMQDDVNGFLAKDMSVNAIAEAIGRAFVRLDDVSVREAARETAIQMSWSQTVQRTASLLEEARGEVEPGEAHCPSTAVALHKKASEISSQLVAESEQNEVLIVGSAARGPARPGSDLDLAIVADGQLTMDQRWAAMEDFPVDLRFIDKTYLTSLADLSLEAFAAENLESWLPDILTGHIALQASTGLLEVVQQIERKRSEQDVINHLVLGQMAKVRMTMGAARQALAAEQAVSAQSHVQMAADQFLTAVLLSIGWRLGGAKRRIEISAACAREHPAIARSVEVVRSITCGDLSIQQATDAVERRETLRAVVIDDLESKRAEPGVVEMLKRHTSGSRYGYYGPALERGLHLGAIHHLRCHSGLPLLPAMYASALGNKEPDELAWFVSEGASSKVVQEWTEVALTSTEIDVVASNISALQTEVRELDLGAMTVHGQ